MAAAAAAALMAKSLSNRVVQPARQNAFHSEAAITHENQQLSAINIC